MAFIIKLFYGSEIKKTIDQSIAFNTFKISELNTTVNSIFTNDHWEPGIFENIKKHAIKSVLKDRIHAYKAKNLPRLMLRLKLLFDRRNAKPITLKSCAELQQDYAAFKFYERDYMLNHYGHICDLTKGKIAINSWKSTIGDEEKSSIFDKIHKKAKKERFLSKQQFQIEAN